MSALKGFWPYLVVAFLGFLVIVLAEPFSNWLETQRTRPAGPVIGKISQGLGTIHHAHGASDKIVALPIAQALELRDGDRIQTAGASRATVILSSGDEIEISPESSVEFQLWNSKDAGSPIYINLFSGGIVSRRPGIKGKAYLVKDGRLYLPGQTPVAKPVALTVLRNAPLDLRLNETGHSGGPDSGEFAADNSPEEVAAGGPASGVDPETLSNEYIDETILAHQGQLQKCWLSRLKDAPASKGQIVVQFEISKRGKVKEMRVADSTLNDEVLQRCVMSVIERISFRPYKGSEISLSYPINFE